MLKLNINSINTPIKIDLDKYVVKKLQRLDKYIPRSARSNAHAEVFLKEQKIKAKKECTCEVIMHLPQNQIVISETTINIFAAVDIVEAKLRNQLKRYKDRHTAKPRIAMFLRHYPKRKTS